MDSKWFSKLFKDKDSSKFAELLADKIISAGKDNKAYDYSEIKAELKLSNTIDRNWHPYNGLMTFKEFLEKGIGEIFEDINSYQEHEQDFLYKNLFYSIATFNLKSLNKQVYSFIDENRDVGDDTESKIQNIQLALAAYSETQPILDQGARLFWNNLWVYGDKKFWFLALHGLFRQDQTLACECMPLLMTRAKDAEELLLKIWEDPKGNSALKLYFKRDTRTMADIKSKLAYKLSSAYEISYTAAMGRIYGLPTSSYKNLN